MKYYLDFHLHSKYSRAVSRDMDLEHIEKAAEQKGIDVVGTGDFTHPEWSKEIKSKLEEAGEGVYKLSADSPVQFLISGEISCIYKKGNKCRKIHIVVIPSTIEAGIKINLVLSWIGNIKSDGRPILGADVRSLAADIWRQDPEALIIPAHVWTPWFSLYGANSGFDSLEECFGDLKDKIFALETGLSSDPEMNWQVPEIRQKVLVSNSDAHSPANLGRELTVLEINEKFSFPLLSKILQEGYQSPAGKISTVEFYPEEGKYHFDGHRACQKRLSPEETKKSNYKCPGCGKPVTVGVLHRVDSLSQGNPSLAPEGAGYLYTVPLRELISQIVYTAPSSKKVNDIYQKVTDEIPEIDYLLEAGEPDLIRYGSEQLAQAVLAMRAGEVERIAGYDGEFGIIKVRQKLTSTPQGSLF